MRKRRLRSGDILCSGPGCNAATDPWALALIIEPEHTSSLGMEIMGATVSTKPTPPKKTALPFVRRTNGPGDDGCPAFCCRPGFDARPSRRFRDTKASTTYPYYEQAVGTTTPSGGGLLASKGSPQTLAPRTSTLSLALAGKASVVGGGR